MSVEAAAPPQGLVRTSPTRLLGVVVAVGLFVVAVTLSIAVGSRTIPPLDVWHYLWHDDGSPEADIVHQVRIPRTILGILVGLSLGLSGALMQALTRNPLAEPGLLGVNVGASAGVVIAIAFVGISSISGYVWFSFAGAALTSVAVFLLGATGRSPTPERQVLAGVALTSVIGALIVGVLVLEPEAFDRFRYWDDGSLIERDAGTVWAILPFILIGTACALSLGRSLNALALGDEAGSALGTNVRRVQAVGMLAVTLLCGAATAGVGPIWFVGLAVPHIARLLTGPDYRWIMVYSLLLAPALLLGADVLGRVVVAPSELSVGIVTAFLGAPAFLILARRRRIAQL